MLTASFGMNNQSYTYINIVDFVKSAADTSRIKPLSLLQTYDALYSSFGLSFAHGFTDFFGIIATGNLGYGELPTNGFKHDYFWDLGVYLDFHLDQPIGWPIGLGIGTKLNSYPIELDDPRDVSRSVFLKLAYNAKRDFVIGIETYYLNIPTNYYDLTFQFYKAQFNIQLYF